MGRQRQRQQSLVRLALQGEAPVTVQDRPKDEGRASTYADDLGNTLHSQQLWSG